MNRPWTGYAWSAGAALLCTAIGWAMAPRFDPVNIAMVYLLAVVVIALRCSRGAAIAAAGLSVLLFDVLFVPPVGTVTVDDLQYLLTFAIMLAVAVVISGLTARVRREAEAKAALAVAAETERVRSTLLASISHDLRTPLAVMAGASSSLAEAGERMGAAERQSLAQSLFRQAQELSGQVDKLLQMTRLESGAIELQRDWVSLPEIAGAVLARLKERLAEHRLIVDLPADFPLLRVDAGLIEQALGNLLENAAKHTPAGTLVRLRAEKSGGEAVISVEDYGPGLPDGDVERVFAKFARGASEASGGGVGLGLAICRAMVRLHGGRAWGEQMPGGGSAFRFSLPLETPPEVPVEAA
jgi:two-component system sensor histidine kinase KdpD